MMSHDVMHDVIIGKLYQEPPLEVYASTAKKEKKALFSHKQINGG